VKGIIMTALDRKQAILAHLVTMVARKVSFGLAVAGPGGLGKSLTISKTLAQEGVTPILLNSHITPLSLFRTMFENKAAQVIWLDDADSIYPNLRILGLLRSALWGQGERVVTYTSTQLGALPSSFTFDSRIIMCANSLPSARNEAFQAVLSRIDVFHLEATNEEIIEQMHKQAELGFGSLSAGQCQEVVAFIVQAGGIRQLSMRLYESSLKKVEYAQANEIDWRDLVRAQLDQLGRKDMPNLLDAGASAHEIMAEVIAAHDSVSMQEMAWCRATGKSRASFYRMKKAIVKEDGK
jgi:hypothetical protein